jgi:hypothetical protein
MRNIQYLLSACCFLFLWNVGIAQVPVTSQPAVQAPADPIPVGGGRFETIQEKVWIAGSQERVWVPPTYTRGIDEFGHPVEILVEPGSYKTITVPGRWQTVSRRVWVADGTPTVPRSFTIFNRRQFQVELQSIHVRLNDGSTAIISLPEDHVISSTKHLAIEPPPNAASMTVRFKTWDWGNKRYQFPVYSVEYDLREGQGTIY